MDIQKQMQMKYVFLRLHQKEKYVLNDEHHFLLLKTHKQMVLQIRKYRF